MGVFNMLLGNVAINLTGLIFASCFRVAFFTRIFSKIVPFFFLYQHDTCCLLPFFFFLSFYTLTAAISLAWLPNTVQTVKKTSPAVLLATTHCVSTCPSTNKKILTFINIILYIVPVKNSCK